MRVGIIFIGVALAALLTAGCSTQPRATATTPPVVSGNHARVAALYRQHQLWQGTPYLLGGSSRDGIDCSAFVQRTYSTLFDYSVPRTTEAQQRLGTAVPRRQLLPGDLVFFRTGDKVRHVGIYVERGRFLHASTSRGVMLSELNNPYWQRHYIQARRVLK
ncbi:NlpC/P60 family protein [Motiliproteus sediminis]|uniref:NlpC/P60 family protein n=1 Tax=Motiliproteus sediminis TaxID=1468178 RepID=UPI001AEF924D|nr:NlpC/P60 family protein [Motiliproteus sediminis]